MSDLAVAMAIRESPSKNSPTLSLHPWMATFEHRGRVQQPNLVWCGEEQDGDFGSCFKSSYTSSEVSTEQKITDGEYKEIVYRLDGIWRVEPTRPQL
ncbi:MAG: hypothetical protein R3C56_16730 [Pirellulaceae bacterium]